MADSVVDNDVVLKGACYGILDDLLASIPGPPHHPGILGTAKFVLPKALARRQLNDRSRAVNALTQALSLLEEVEPTKQESELAAALENEAQRRSIAMHHGECLLIAILVVRNLKCLLTGDRNAIRGLASLLPGVAVAPDSLNGKIICFEQAIRYVMQSRGAAAVRTVICAEPEVDTAMRLSFSCANPGIPEESWWEGIESQISSLRAESQTFLYL